MTCDQGAQPGFAYALDRVARFLAPPIEVGPLPSGIRFLRDLEVPMRDGVRLRVNLFRPEQDEPCPVVLCAHPYGKDGQPRRLPFGGHLLPPPFRMMRQSAPFTISEAATWESPDPAFWVPRGYAVVNADLRGFFRSEGEGRLLSDQEAQDYHDLIEWAAVQPWSTGKVGLNGVSYLAMCQYKAAALQPPHLAAMIVWEGLTDFYRDLAFPGGIRETGFAALWGRAVALQRRCRTDITRLRHQHPLRDAAWQELVPQLDRIQTPILVCASFSDHNLHSGGSFRAFCRVSSSQRWLRAHRRGKWADYYSEQGLATQLAFFDHFLKGEANGWERRPPVRVEVQDTDSQVAAVHEGADWPLPGTDWTTLYLASGRLQEALPEGDESEELDLLNGRLSFLWEIAEELDLIGPMKLTLHLELLKGSDASLFVGVRKLRGGRHVVFEGSYGFGFDMVTRGWLKLSHRELDPEQSGPYLPVHHHRRELPMVAGQAEPVEIALLPSATHFRPGDQLRVDIQGRGFFSANPLRGQFPARYEPSPPGRVRLRCAGVYPSRLLIPRFEGQARDPDPGAAGGAEGLADVPHGPPG